MMRLVIVTPQPLLADGIDAALDTEDFEIVGRARTIKQALGAIRRENPDAAFVDTSMGDGNAAAMVARIAGENPEVKVLLFAEELDLEQAQAAFIRGAYGYILANIDLRDLAAAIRVSLLQTAYQARGLPALESATAARAADLTKRELAVLEAAAEALSTREIAKALWVTEHTVKFHLTNVYRKAGVTNRGDALRWATERGIV